MANEADQIRSSIVKLVLAGDPSVPDTEDVTQFRMQYCQHRSESEALQRRIDDLVKAQNEALQRRINDLAKAQNEYSLLERRFKEADKLVTSSKAKVTDFAKPLGHAVFEAFQNGKVGSNPAFEQRIEAQNELDRLRDEHDALTPPDTATFVQKSMARAQQAVVTGKVKLKELGLPKLETEIGRQFIDSNDEGHVECDATHDLVGRIQKARLELKEHEQKCESERAALEVNKSDLAETSSLSQVRGAETFSEEIARSRLRVGEIKNDVSKLQTDVIDTWMTQSNTLPDGQFKRLLDSLRSAPAPLVAHTSVDNPLRHEAGAGLGLIEISLRKTIGIIVIVLGVVSSGMFFSAGSQLHESGETLTILRSEGGNSVAEAYYQEVGRYGIAYSRFACALGFGTLMLSVGLGGTLILKEDK